MDFYCEQNYHFDANTGRLAIITTGTRSLLALEMLPVKSVIIRGGGGVTYQVELIIKVAMSKDIPIVIEVGFSAGVWYALSEYVDVPANTFLQMHGMGQPSSHFSESLHFLRASYSYLDLGVKNGIFKESRVKYLKNSFEKHLLNRPASFWENFHPTSMWYEISELADK